MPRLPDRLTVKGTAPWQHWVRDTATRARIKPADLVDIALADYARAHGYPPPPARLTQPERPQPRDTP